MGIALARVIVPLDLKVVRNPDTALDHLQGPLIIDDCRMIDDSNLFIEVQSPLSFPGYLTVLQEETKPAKQVLKGTKILTYFFLPALPQQNCLMHYMAVRTDWQSGTNKFRTARPCREATEAFIHFMTALKKF